MSSSFSSGDSRSSGSGSKASDPPPAGLSIRDNRARARYELRIDGEPTGWLEYRHNKSNMIVAHTEIAADHQGEGLAPLLVRRALEDARQAGKPIVPTCAFARGYIARHPELDEYLVPHLRRGG